LILLTLFLCGAELTAKKLCRKLTGKKPQTLDFTEFVFVCSCTRLTSMSKRTRKALILLNRIFKHRRSETHPRRTVRREIRGRYRAAVAAGVKLL
jgi:hypothetical protein